LQEFFSAEQMGQRGEMRTEKKRIFTLMNQLSAFD
jgi:hypothetical protein